MQVELIKEPEVSGSCVRDGDTAVLTMTWSVFNFSLIFTENPEGNSYYLNTAVLRYVFMYNVIHNAYCVRGAREKSNRMAILDCK